MRFSLDADEVYRAGAAADADDFNWLLSVAEAYEGVRRDNVGMASWMTRLSAAFAVLVVVHAGLWIAALMGVE